MKIASITLIAFLALSSFRGKGDKNNSCMSGSKGAVMTVRDTMCCSATDTDFIYKGDTLELPYCVAYPCSGKIKMEKDPVTGKMKMINNIKRLPEKEPFYLNKDVDVKLMQTAIQEKYFNDFKMKVFNSIQDTALRSEVWFSLSSIEWAIKSNDAISYMMGLKHLSAVWKKMSAN